MRFAPTTISRRLAAAAFTAMATLFFAWMPLAAFAQDAPAPAVTTTPVEKFRPTLSIPIPDLTFSNITISEDKSSRTIDVPWLAQYIVAIYKYGIVLAGTLASVMFMVGGFQYLTAGDDSGRVAKGKKRITDALLGIVILLGSYIVLQTINPDLVNLTALQVTTVKSQPFTPESREDGGDIIPSGGGGGTGAATRVCDTVETCTALCNKPKTQWPGSTPGMMDPSEAVTIPTIPGLNGGGQSASQTVVDGLRKAAAKANELGYTIRVTGGYRSLRTQIEMACKLVGDPKTAGDIGKNIAWPGGSNHGAGTAVDVQLLHGTKVLVGSGSCAAQSTGSIAKPDDSKTFDKIMSEAGAKRYSNEVWHYEFGSSVTACRCVYPNCPPPPHDCHAGC